MLLFHTVLVLKFYLRIRLLAFPTWIYKKIISRHFFLMANMFSLLLTFFLMANMFSLWLTCFPYCLHFSLLLTFFLMANMFSLWRTCFPYCLHFSLLLTFFLTWVVLIGHRPNRRSRTLKGQCHEFFLAKLSHLAHDGNAEVFSNTALISRRYSN